MPGKRAVRAKYDLTVVAEGDGADLIVGGFEIVGTSGSFSSGGEPMATEGLVSAGRLSSQGRAFTPTDLEPMRKAIDELNAAAVPPGESPSSGIERYLAAARQDDALKASAINTMHMLVLGFAEGMLDPGHPHTSRLQAPIPLPGTPLVSLVTEMSVVPGVPCVDGGPKECVQVTSVSTVEDREAASAAVAEATRGFAKQIDFLEVRSSSTYVVNPRTLQPFSIQVKKFIQHKGIYHNERFVETEEAGWSSRFSWLK